jgi:hypothetical protein
VVGETVFSWLWDTLFKKRFWIYYKEKMFHSYTSLLNFIPWGVAGIIPLSIVRLLNLEYKWPLIESNFESPFIWYWMIFLCGFLMIFIYRAIVSLFTSKESLEFEKVSILNYLIFVLPIIGGILFLTLYFSVDYLVFFLSVGIVGWVCEYAFGRMCVFFISHKLWGYEYMSLGNKRITPLSIIPFAWGGFYFWTIGNWLFNYVIQNVGSASYSYAYFYSALLFFPIWITLFLLRKDLRGQMIFMSLTCAITGFTEHMFWGRYWSPELVFKMPLINVDVSDLLLTFAYGGISSVAFEVLFSKMGYEQDKYTQLERTYQIGISLLSGILTVALLSLFTSFNIIYSVIAANVVVWLVLVFFRHDTFIPSVLNGLIFMIISEVMWIFIAFVFPGIIQAWWHLENISEILILGIPIEEYVWHFTFGMAAASMYEIWKGKYYRKKVLPK